FVGASPSNGDVSRVSRTRLAGHHYLVVVEIVGGESRDRRDVVIVRDGRGNDDADLDHGAGSASHRKDLPTRQRRPAVTRSDDPDMRSPPEDRAVSNI